MPAPRCRSCSSTSGEIVLDLGEQPACEYFPPFDDPTPDPLFPLRLWLCAGCGLAQLADDADLPDQPEGLEPVALTGQRHDAVVAAHAAGLLPAGATIAEGPTPHGGSWWPELEVLGLRRAAPGASADIVVDGAFGLMHAPDQAAALAALVDALTPDGTLLLQFHSLAAILREQQWNAVRLGHHAYYSLPSLQAMLAGHGLTLTRVWTFPLYGGTVLAAARRGGIPDLSVAETLDAETAAGVLDAGVLATLQKSVDADTTALRTLTADARRTGARVYGYSAASRAVALLYLADLPDGLLHGVADASLAKQGRRMPGTTIPVIGPDQLTASRPDIVVMFVSDLLPEVRAALPGVEADGGRWAEVGTDLHRDRDQGIPGGCGKTVGAVIKTRGAY